MERNKFIHISSPKTIKNLGQAYSISNKGNCFFMILTEKHDLNDLMFTFYHY